MSEKKRYQGELSEPHVDVTGGGGARKVFLLAAAIAAAAGAWAYLNGGSSQEGAQAPIAGSEKAGE
jgi:hypothetical protein